MSHRPVAYSISCLDPAELAAYSAKFDDDDTAYVASLRSTFFFDAASLATVDNLRVINGPAGVGRWLITPVYGSIIFGGGDDDGAQMDGINAYAWATLLGSVYTLTRDVFFGDGCRVYPGITLYTAGFRVFCDGTFTNDGIVHNDGKPGVLGAAGAASALGTTGVGTAGGAGRSNNTGVAGSAMSYGSPDGAASGGAGGAGGANAGGAGGAFTSNPAGSGGSHYLAPMQSGYCQGQTSGGNQAATFIMGGGAGGGGGGSNNGGVLGGGGGGGAGALLLHCLNLVNNGVVHAVGGRGADASGAGGNGGGGGGGGGGLINSMARFRSGAGTFSVAGGAGGAALNAGVAGSSGGPGNINLHWA